MTELSRTDLGQAAYPPALDVASRAARGVRRRAPSARRCRAERESARARQSLQGSPLARRPGGWPEQNRRSRFPIGPGVGYLPVPTRRPTIDVHALKKALYYGAVIPAVDRQHGAG